MYSGNWGCINNSYSWGSEEVLWEEKSILIFEKYLHWEKKKERREIVRGASWRKNQYLSLVQQLSSCQDLLSTIPPLLLPSYAPL